MYMKKLKKIKGNIIGYDNTFKHDTSGKIYAKSEDIMNMKLGRRKLKDYERKTHPQLNNQKLDDELRDILDDLGDWYDLESNRINEFSEFKKWSNVRDKAIEKIKKLLIKDSGQLT